MNRFERSCVCVSIDGIETIDATFCQSNHAKKKEKEIQSIKVIVEVEI